MDRIPTKNGRPCVFRVVRVSGTMRKVEEEAIRQARLLMLEAKEGGAIPSAQAKKTDALSSMFGTAATSTKSIQNISIADVVSDSSDSEDGQDLDDYDDGDEQDGAG